MLIRTWSSHNLIACSELPESITAFIYVNPSLFVNKTAPTSMHLSLFVQQCLMCAHLCAPLSVCTVVSNVHPLVRTSLRLCNCVYVRPLVCTSLCLYSSVCLSVAWARPITPVTTGHSATASATNTAITRGQMDTRWWGEATLCTFVPSKNYQIFIESSV